MSLNKVMLIGNVGQNPEVRYLDNSQVKVARIRLATTERYRDRNGEQRENTEWHTVTCWRNQADVVERFVQKGTQIYVEGKLQTREWTDQNGGKRTSTEVVADNIQLLGKRSDNPAGQQNGGYQGAPSYGGQAPAQAAPAAAQNVGGYQAPYQPNTAPSSIPTAPATDFNSGNGEDDLPF